MRLVSLTLQGFKSFANKTTLEFTPGVTAIVGPNGSGKSNVIDALRWASGGGRASEFRAEGKTDLIFHGAAGQRSLGYAEVTVEVERGGKGVHVSRSLFRDGQTKLRLGGKTARFLDVEEALSGSGLARGGLSIIGQGEVSQVLMADPPTLLSYVEEAAGVAKLSSRREQTLSRLAMAREHLERLEDVMGELRRQLETLEREAQEAERSAALNREQLALRYTLAYRRVESLQREMTELEAQRQNVAAGLAYGKEQLATARDAWTRLRGVLSETEALYRRATQEAEARRGDLRVARERLAAARVRREGLVREERGVKDELAALAGAEAPRPPEGDREALERELAAQTADLSAQRERLIGLETQLRDLSPTLEAARRTAFTQAQAVKNYETQKATLEAQLAEVTERLKGLEAEVDLSSLETNLANSQAAADANDAQFRALQERLATLQGAHANAYAEAQARNRALVRTQVAFEARRGYAQGPKNALTSGIAGVIGSVADLLRVPAEYQSALSSALGRRSENVVVESAEVAKEVLAHVRRSGGWVTLLPLELVKGRQGALSNELRNEPSIIGLCAELVEADARFTGIVNQLLGTTALVTSLDDAVTLARRYRQRPRFVTLRGDVMESYGAMTGGRPQGSGAVLGLGVELQEAEKAAQLAAQEEGARGEEVGRLQAEVRALNVQRNEGAERLQQDVEAVREARERLAARASLQAELSRRQGELEAQLADLSSPEPSDGIEREVDALEFQVTEKQAYLMTLRENLRTVEEVRNETAQTLALLIKRQEDYERASLRFQADQARLAQVEVRVGALQREVTAALEAENAVEVEVRGAQARVPQNLDAQERALRDAQKRTQDAEAALGELTQRQAERGASLEEVKLTLARREAAAEVAQEELSGFPEGLEPLEGGLRGLRERLNAVSEELETLGPVNYRAAQEAQVQRERWETLVAQSSEASLAADELTAVLTDIEGTVRTRLNAALTQLKTRFAEHIQQLFGAGAEAGIDTLVEEGRPTGLKISLQPPGKQTRSLNLLSVGERTMGAMAFLFALMSGEGEGLPIAILDEVDAPLDEANIRRFCAFLEQLAAQGTQFVLITHQKATMEVARTLWGVTTERGVSRVFSISRAAEEVAL